MALFLMGSILVLACGTPSFEASSRGTGPGRTDAGPRPLRENLKAMFDFTRE
jgi:hypothetical protein